MERDQIIKQSKAAYKQWAAQWRVHAKEHSKLKMKSFDQLRNTGIGKAILCVANGYSFEENIETIKANKDNVDIICCDKTLGHLIDNGIYPTYCMVCDANVDYEKYMKPWEDKLYKTILFQNICGNPKWSFNGNWKDKYFYANKDVMGYEKEFLSLANCPNVVPAGTNVSNMMVVILVQSDNDRKQNLFAYDKMLLIGYDYSWKEGGKYYAFDEDGGGKKYYMRHIYGISPSGNLIFSSNNLSASCSWLRLYVDTFKLNVVQCSQDSMGVFGKMGKLEEQIRYRHKPSDAKRVQNLLFELHGIDEKRTKIQNTLRDIGRDHWYKSHSI